MSAAPTSNARRRNPFGDDADSTMMGTSGADAMGSVDDLQRAVVLAALTGDEDDVDRLAPERLHRLVDAVRHADELEERVVGQGPLHVEGVEAFDGHERSDEGFGHGATYLAVRFLLAWLRRVSIVTVRAGVFLAPTCGRSRNHSVPLSDANASFCARRASAFRTYVDDWPAVGARTISTFGASSVSRLPSSAGQRDVDVDVVALGGVAHEAPGSVDRDGDPALEAGERRRDGLARGDAQVCGRDLLAGEDVARRDAAVQVRRVGDRADLEVVLRQAGDLEELLLGDDRARRCPVGMRFFATRTGVAAFSALTLDR